MIENYQEIFETKHYPKGISCEELGAGRAANDPSFILTLKMELDKAISKLNREDDYLLIHFLCLGYSVPEICYRLEYSKSAFYRRKLACINKVKKLLN